MIPALLIAMVLITLLLFMSVWLPQTAPTMEKLSPYECGFDPLGSARLPFPLRFFLVAILFLLFDLEIALLLPTPWAINSATPKTTMTFIYTVILLLILVLIYEWHLGGLEWAE